MKQLILSLGLASLVGLSACLPLAAQTGVITTIAGGGTLNPTATAAFLNLPTGVAVDAAGNVYIAVAAGEQVVKLDPTGHLTVVAGTGFAGYSGDGGPATAATIDLSNAYIEVVSSLALDSSGNVYIADVINNVIRRVDASTGIIHTVAGNGTAGYSGDGGPAAMAALSNPTGVAVDAFGNLFIADDGNSVIRRVDAVTGAITTIAGNGTAGYSGDGGPATAATFNLIGSLAVDGTDNVYVADTFNGVVREIHAASGIVSTVAGGGPDPGADGIPATQANLSPTAVLTDAAGNLYIVEAGQGRDMVLRVDAGGTIHRLAGSPAGSGFSGDGGPATNAQLNLSAGGGFFAVGSLALDAAGNLVIPDAYNMRVRKISTSGAIATIAGGGSGGDGAPASQSVLGFVTSLNVDGSGNLLLSQSSDGRVRRVDAASGLINTVAGNGTPVAYASQVGDGGPAAAADLGLATYLGAAPDGGLLIADTQGDRVRAINASGIITTLAGGGALPLFGDRCPPPTLGDGGPATAACLSVPHGVAADSAGNLYIADKADFRVRKVTPDGAISTIAGTGIKGCTGDGGPATAAELGGPTGLALDAAGDIYLSDCNNIRRIDASTGAITTIAGNGTTAFTSESGPALATSLGLAEQLAVDALGNIYIADAQFNRIRRYDPLTDTLATIAGAGSTSFAAGSFSGDGGLATQAALDTPYALALTPAGDLIIGDSANLRVRSVNLPPFADYSTMALAFGNRRVGTQPELPVTITNTGTKPLHVSAPSLGGDDAHQFKIEGDTCPAALAPGQSCTVTVSFHDGGPGPAVATLILASDAAFSNQVIPITGTTVLPH